MISISKYSPDDYSLLCSWFDQYKWDVAQPEDIPPNSFFVEIDGVKAAFSCFYRTDAPLCVMGFTISDRGANKEYKGEALDYLIQYVFKKAEETGCKYLSYFTEHKAIADRYVKNGMKFTDNGNAYILLKTFGNSPTLGALDRNE